MKKRKIELNGANAFEQILSLKIHSQSIWPLYIFSNSMNNFICNWNFRQFDSFISDQELLTNMENSKNNLSFLQTSIPSQIRIPIEYFWEGNGNISQKIGCHLKTFAYLLTHQAILSSKFGEPESETTSTTTLAKSSSVVAIIGWHYAPGTFKMWT